jgi:GT2 family glycosyltransferase
MSQIAVAVVNFNTREYLDACLRSVTADGAEEIVVVDNASHDGSVEMVRTSFPQVRLLPNSGDRGFGAAANQAVAACTAPYVLLLNADTLLRPGALHGLRTYLDRHPKAGIAGPRLENLDGSLQASCFPAPTPFNEFLELSNLSAALRFVPVVRNRYLRTWRHDRPRAVPWLNGAAMAMRREAFESIGGFDESFFMYSEEIDLCFRMRANGWQIHFTPDAAIAHVGGASTRQNRVEMAARALTSRVMLYRRHFSRGRLLQLRLVVTAGMVAKLTRDALRLLGARDPSRRSRLAEDLRVWRTVLGQIWRRSPV